MNSTLTVSTNTLYLLLLLTFISLGMSCSSTKELKSAPKHDNSQVLTDSIISEEKEHDTILSEKIDLKPLLNFNFSENIKSIRLTRAGFDQSYPYMDLNGDQLILSFDDLKDESEIYTIRFLHCNIDWTPSPLNESEYIEGFYSNEIIDIESSHNTIHHYYHYRYKFPNEDVQFTKSGNYVLMISDINERIVFSKRFQVYSDQTIIEGKTVRPNNPKYQYNDQALSFSVNLNNLEVDNVLQNLKVIAVQNYRWDNSIWEFKPTFIKDNLIEFKQTNGNHFSGLKEYRYVDIRSLYHHDGKLSNFKTTATSNEAVLFDDEVRSYKSYIHLEDLNGRFTLVNRDQVNPDNESDYIDVYFTLPYENDLFEDEGLFILGHFNNFQPSDKYRMAYDLENKKYIGKIRLKQGYYEYLYGLYNFKSKEIDYGFIEGNSPETENDYLLFVYLHNQFENYDQLIGIKILNTINK